MLMATARQWLRVIDQIDAHRQAEPNPLLRQLFISSIDDNPNVLVQIFGKQDQAFCVPGSPHLGGAGKPGLSALLDRRKTDRIQKHTFLMH